MATRIEIEITSDRGDGTLTWRAAGAKQPKGSFEAALLPDGAKVGDVLRAEAEFTVDGPELVSIEAPREAKPDLIQRLEVTGSGKANEGGVTTQLAKKGRGRSQGRRGGPRSGPGGGRRDGGGRSDGGGRRGPKPTLRPGRKNRLAWIESLEEHRRPVAEQLMHEGREGVSDALKRQNALAAAEGRDQIDVGPIMRITDELLPALKQAEFLDTLEAASEQSETADLRELRKVYAQGAEFESDESVATALTNLRSKINSRVTSDQAKWAREVREALTEGRVVRALRSSGRPVKAGAPLPDDLVNQLSEAASGALSADEESYRWVSVLEALASSPVRRLVAPEAKPESVDDDLLDTVDRLAHLLPGVAKLFGVSDAKPSRRS